MSQAEKTFLFFFKCPNVENLVTLSLKLVTEQGIKLSYFSERIQKCRELIFDECDIVVTPDKYFENQITAVFPKSRFYTVDFKQKLDKMRLKLLKVDVAFPSVLQECIQYTATVKLAPQWNTVQHLMIQGREFLINSDPLRAVYFEVVVNGTEITLCVKPTCVRLPPFKIENYGNASSETTFAIDGKCHVLPSLKVGKAVCLSKHINVTNSALKNYADFRRYWKNMYGYCLPDVPEQDVWYVSIMFNVRWTPLTYPYFCIRPYGMTEVPRVDPQPTLQAFIADFCQKVGNICQEQCRVLDWRASFPLLKMYPATEVTENAKPKLGSTYTMIHDQPYRSVLVYRSENNDNFPKVKCDKRLKVQGTSQSEKSVDEDSSEKVSKDSRLNNIFNQSKGPPKFLQHSAKNSSSFSTKNISKTAKFIKKLESFHSDLSQTECTRDKNSRFFKRLGVEDLSLLSRNFVEFQPKATDGVTCQEVIESNSLKPKYVPKFLPRPRTLPEMFSKVKTSTQRKRSSKLDSRPLIPSSTVVTRDVAENATNANGSGKKLKGSKSNSGSEIQKKKSQKKPAAKKTSKGKGKK